MRGAAFIVFSLGWFEKRDFWPVMVAGLSCTLLSFVIDDGRDNGALASQHRNWPFWTVLVLSAPAVAAVAITASALIRPNESLWVLPILLYFYIPVALVISTVVAAMTQYSMRPERRRSTWRSLAVALSAVPLTYALLLLAEKHVESLRQ